MTRSAPEAAEIRIIQERATGTIIPRGCLGIPDRFAFSVEALHRVRTVFVAPVSIRILTIEMVVFAWMNHHGDLAAANGTAALERGPLEIRHIFLHQA